MTSWPRWSLCRWLIENPEVVRGAIGLAWAAALNG